MPKPQICPRCGEPLQDGICDSCTRQTYALLEKPILLKLRTCPECLAADTGHGWSPPGEVEKKGLLNVAGEMIKSELKIPQPGRLLELEIEPLGYDEYMVDFKLKVRVDVDGVTVDREGRARVKTRRSLCDSCSRAAGSYYEATIQFRARDRKPDSKEIEKFVEIIYPIIDEQRERGDQKSFVTDVYELKEGVDFLIGSAKVARRIATRIASEFGADIIETSTLAGRKDGRELYRITISIKLPRFQAGDVVSSGKNLMVVEKAGKRLKGYMLPSHEHEEVDPEGAILIGNLADSRTGVVVAVESGAVQVIEPWGNHCVVLRSPGKTRLSDGEDVPLMRVDDEIFILRGESPGGLGT